MTVSSRHIIHATAAQLHNHTIGYWPGPDGTYPTHPHAPPIYAKHLPPTPDTCIAITTYALNLEINPDLGRTFTIRIQVRVRAPQDADPIADQILTVLHGQHRQEWEGLYVERCRHLSTAQLGTNPGGLDERTDNFELTITHTLKERSTQ